MAIQFSSSMARFMRGRRVNMEEWNTVTRVLEGSTPVGFGVPVQRGTDAKQCQPYTNGDVIGITEADFVLPHPGDEYRQYDSVGVCEVGVIGVLAGGTVTHGTAAAYDPAANSGEGGWVAADTGASAIPGAVFETSGSVGEVVALRYRRPNV